MDWGCICGYDDGTYQPGRERDVYLVNLGDVSRRHLSVGGSYRYFTDNGWILGANGQMETGFNSIREKSAISNISGRIS
jgi:hypothetical protein